MPHEWLGTKVNKPFYTEILSNSFKKDANVLEYYFIWLIGQFNVLAIACVVCLHKENSSSLILFYASYCSFVGNLLLNRNKVSFMINYKLPNIRTFGGLGGGDGHWVTSQLSFLGEKIPSFRWLSLFIIYRPSLSLFECICSSFFIGLEPTGWQSNNSPHVIVC